MFVQVQQKWRRMYTGECQGPGVRTDFEIVQLRKVPSQYNHLSGLLDIFKSKIVSSMVGGIWKNFTYVIYHLAQILLKKFKETGNRHGFHLLQFMVCSTWFLVTITHSQRWMSYAPAKYCHQQQMAFMVYITHVSCLEYPLNFFFCPFAPLVLHVLILSLHPHHSLFTPIVSHKRVVFS